MVKNERQRQLDEFFSCNPNILILLYEMTALREAWKGILLSPKSLLLEDREDIDSAGFEWVMMVVGSLVGRSRSACYCFGKSSPFSETNLTRCCDD
jgi:hypothetical protein